MGVRWSSSGAASAPRPRRRGKRPNDRMPPPAGIVKNAHPAGAGTPSPPFIGAHPRSACAADMDDASVPQGRRLGGEDLPAALRPYLLEVYEQYLPAPPGGRHRFAMSATTTP